MASDQPRNFDEGPEMTFREAFPTIKNIQVEVVQGDSLSWNPSEPRIYSQSNFVDRLAPRMCASGRFSLRALIEQVMTTEKRRSVASS